MAACVRLWQPSGGIILMAAFGLLPLAGCERAPDGNAAENTAEPANVAAAETPPPLLPKVPIPLPPLGRGDLLAASNAAADAVARGAPLPEENRALVGRSFEIRLPFGCTGPSAEDAADWAGWSYNPESGALKLVARAEITENWPQLRTLARDMRFDAVEGFWIRRPWTSAETCPANAASGPADGAAKEPKRQTLGIVRFFSPDEPRTLRRGSRPYSATIKIDAEDARVGNYYNLVLSGRIADFAANQPVHCQAEAPDLRPICLIAVEFSRVAFEDPSDQRIIQEWRG